MTRLPREIRYRRGRRKDVLARVPCVRTLFLHIEANKIADTEIAEISGVHAYTISKWRLGHTTPNLIQFLAVANTVGLDIKMEPLP